MYGYLPMNLYLYIYSKMQFSGELDDMNCQLSFLIFYYCCNYHYNFFFFFFFYREAARQGD